MRFFILWLWAMSLFLAGCAAEKHYALGDVNIENGTVRLYYDYTVFERPQIVGKQADTDTLAGQECWAMGYEQVLIPPKREILCLKKNGNADCINTRINLVYECAGGRAGRNQQKQKDLKAAASPRQLSQDVRHMYYAEQFAREHGCSAALKPESVSPAKEVYSTVCRGEQIYITCNRAGCSSK